MATKKKGNVVKLNKADGPPPPTDRDPYQINARLQRQVSEMLRQLEDEDETVTLKERYMALASIARIQYIFVNLRKEKVGDPNVGTNVRKYAGAFAKQNDARRRAANARPAADPEPERQDGADQPWWDDNDTDTFDDTA